MFSAQGLEKATQFIVRYLQFLNGGVLFVDLEIILSIIFSLLLATNKLVQILLVNLIQSSLQVISQALQRRRGPTVLTMLT